MAAQPRRGSRNAVILVSSIATGALAGALSGLAANSGLEIPATIVGSAAGGVVGILIERRQNRAERRAVIVEPASPSVNAPPVQATTPEQKSIEI